LPNDGFQPAIFGEYQATQKKKSVFRTVPWPTKRGEAEPNSGFRRIFLRIQIPEQCFSRTIPPSKHKILKKYFSFKREKLLAWEIIVLYQAEVLLSARKQ
jgi:hypothetical protein